MTKQQGQSLIEFSVWAGTATLAILAAATLWGSIWRKTKCSHLVFEATHRARIGLPLTAEQVRWVRLQSNISGAIGEARCGESFERIFLPTLDYYDPKGKS